MIVQEMRWDCPLAHVQSHLLCSGDIWNEMVVVTPLDEGVGLLVVHRRTM